MIVEASGGLSDQVAAIIYRVEQWVKLASTKLPQQRRRDSTIASRLIHRLEQLFRNEPGSVLTAPEAAIVLLVPYVYDAGLAAAAWQLWESSTRTREMPAAIDACGIGISARSVRSAVCRCWPPLGTVDSECSLLLLSARPLKLSLEGKDCNSLLLGLLVTAIGPGSKALGPLRNAMDRRPAQGTRA